MNKIIFVTAVQCLGGIVAAFCYVLGIFAMIFPAPMASFFEAAGNRNLSAMYYGRVYERNKTDENLYTVLSKSIIAKDSEQTLKYGYKWFFELTDAARLNITERVDKYLVDRAIARNANLTGDALETILMTEIGIGCNTDDYLRCGYISVLLSNGGDNNFENAVLLYNHATVSNIVYLDRPCYAIKEFGNRATQEMTERFDAYYAAIELELDALYPEGTSMRDAAYYKAKAFLEYFEGGL